MQQPELLAVALVLWGGILVFLFYLLTRMMRIENNVKQLIRAQEED
jgi:hypothetical protein